MTSRLTVALTVADTTPTNSRKGPSAYDRLVAMLARRDHSRKEIREKLSRAQHSIEEIEALIAFAEDHRWLADEETLASREANRLARAGKSRPQIMAWLRKKGLPADAIVWEIPQDELELEGALKIAQSARGRLQRAAVKDAKREAQKRMARKFSTATRNDGSHADESGESAVAAAMKNRLYRLLVSRGFSSATARAVCARLATENAL